MKKFVYVFDLDGTLIKNMAFKYAYRKLPTVLKLDISPDEFSEMFINTYYELVKQGRLKEAFNWDFIIESILNRFGKTYSKDLFLELMIDGLKKNLIEVLDEAHEVLSLIKKMGHLIIVFTNGYRKYQLPVLRRTRLIDYVDILLTADDLEKLKPHAEAFEKIFDIAKEYDKSQMIFVGDHPYYDIYGALNAGLGKIFWRTNFYRSGEYTVKEVADYIIKYAKGRYNLNLDLTPFYNRKIIIINKLTELLDMCMLMRFDV